MAPTVDTPTPAPVATTPAPSKTSLLIGLLYSLGITAATIFVKNPAHQQTAQTIIQVLNAELPILQELL